MLRIEIDISQLRIIVTFILHIQIDYFVSVINDEKGAKLFVDIIYPCKKPHVVHRMQ